MPNRDLYLITSKNAQRYVAHIFSEMGLIPGIEYMQNKFCIDVPKPLIDIIADMYGPRITDDILDNINAQFEHDLSEWTANIEESDNVQELKELIRAKHRQCGEPVFSGNTAQIAINEENARQAEQKLICPACQSEDVDKLTILVCRKCRSRVHGLD